MDYFTSQVVLLVAQQTSYYCTERTATKQANHTSRCNLTPLDSGRTPVLVSTRWVTVKNVGCCHVIILCTNILVTELIRNLKRRSSYEYLLRTKTQALNILSLSQWCRVLLEKLIASQLVKSIPCIVWNPSFFATFTTAHHLSIPRTRRIQSKPSHTIL
jgi:hypothetical protein